LNRSLLYTPEKKMKFVSFLFSVGVKHLL
jgi:hypothetical protein